MKNEQKYNTAEERNYAFAKYCGSRLCQECKLHDKRNNELTCAFNWLSLEAEDEKPEPCPFCGGITTNVKCGGVYRVECVRCGYKSANRNDPSAAIAAHNRVARAVRAAVETTNN